MLEGDRFCEGDRGKALAGHSTLTRLELGAHGGDGRYKKILAQAEEIEALLLAEGVKSIPRGSREIVLDFDAIDYRLQGAQEGAFSHGYYRNYCYLPLYCFLRSHSALDAIARCQARCKQRHGGSAREDYPGQSGGALAKRRASLCAKTFTAVVGKWKIGSRKRRWTCLPISPARTGWLPTNCGCGSVPLPTCLSRCCGPKCCAVHSWPKPAWARSAASFLRLQPGSKSAAAESIWSWPVLILIAKPSPRHGQT